MAQYPLATVEPIQVAALGGLKIATESVGGSSLVVVLDDQTSQRVIWFSIFPTGTRQDLNLGDNLLEALGIVQSMQL